MKNSAPYLYANTKQRKNEESFGGYLKKKNCMFPNCAEAVDV